MLNKEDALSERIYNCFCCETKVQEEQIQYSFGNGVCHNCYENINKISKAIESNIDPYTLDLTDEQKEKRNRVARGILVDDVVYVKCNIQKELFKEFYYNDLNSTLVRNDNTIYLFNCDDETRIYFDKKCGIPYMQFWDASEFAFHTSTYRSPSMKYPISFIELELLAKNTSNELYKKYKDIDECNWKKYI